MFRLKIRTKDWGENSQSPSWLSTKLEGLIQRASSVARRYPVVGLGKYP